MVDYAHGPDPFAAAVVPDGYDRDRVFAIFQGLANAAVRRRLGRSVGPYDCRILLGDLALEHCKRRRPPFTPEQHSVFTNAVTILVSMLRGVAMGSESQAISNHHMAYNRTRAVLLRWFDRVEKGIV